MLFRSAHAVGGGAGASTFDTLSDTPAEKVGHGTKLVRVNSAEDALDYPDVYVDDAGQLGVGVEAPEEKLHVDGVGLFDNTVQIKRYGVNQFQSANIFLWRFNGTPESPSGTLAGYKIGSFNTYSVTDTLNSTGQCGGMTVVATEDHTDTNQGTQMYYETILDGEDTLGVRAIIAGNGYFGINNLIPAYPLDVTGDVNTTGSYLVNGIAISHADIDFSNLPSTAGAAGTLYNNGDGILRIA